MRRKKTARNLLLAAALVALGIGLFLSPWIILRFQLWREAPEAEVLWAGSLAYGAYTHPDGTAWLGGTPVLYARTGDELLSCDMTRHKGHVFFSPVDRDPWPEKGKAALVNDHHFPTSIPRPQEDDTLALMAAFHLPEGTVSAKAVLTDPEGRVRPVQGEMAGEIMLFSVPRRGEKTGVLSGPILREGLLRFTVAVAYYDKDGNVLLTWDGPVELWWEEDQT